MDCVHRGETAFKSQHPHLKAEKAGGIILER